MRLALIFICTLAWAAAAGPDPAIVLQRVTIKQRVRAALLPNYTCVETVTRDYYAPDDRIPPETCSAVMEQPPSVHSTWTDRLRLDVALTSRGEIYSWVGASRFEDSNVSDLIHQGPIGTGSFGAMLVMVFGQNADTFRFERSLPDGARTLLQYSFQVPKEDSHYKVRAGEGWAFTAYSGTVEVDPETNEVVHLTVQTAELPPAAGTCRINSIMDFRLTQIGNGEFPLPTLGRQQFVNAEGEKVENDTTFASCREYRGDSTITFFSNGDGASPEGGPNHKAPDSQVPAGLPFTFELTVPLSAQTAAAGDPFFAKLSGALRYNGKILAKAGSKIEGRLLRVEIRRTPPFAANFVLKPATLEINGVSVPFAADRRQAPSAAGRRTRTPVLLLRSWEQHAAILQAAGQHAVLKTGTRCDWTTSR